VKLWQRVAILGVLALCAKVSLGACAVVQSCENSATAGATSIACALGAAPTAANALYVAINFTGGTQASVVIGNGTDAETLVGSVVNDGGTRSAQYEKRNITGGGSATFTWSNATSLTNLSIFVAEISGIDTAAGLIGNANPAAAAFGSATDAITTGTVSNASGQNACFIGTGVDGPADVITIAAGTGATSIRTGWLLGTANPGARFEYKSGLATGSSYALTWTGGYGGHTYKAFGVMFQEAVGGASTVISPLGGGGGAAARPVHAMLDLRPDMPRWNRYNFEARRARPAPRETLRAVQ
jgi:hypothetical protein